MHRGDGAAEDKGRTSKTRPDPFMEMWLCKNSMREITKSLQMGHVGAGAGGNKAKKQKQKQNIFLMIMKGFY